MPTGYTAKLCDEGQSFQDFVLGCARAFGACITMRDDSSDTPIPERFEPSSHYAEALKGAKAEYERLSTMNEAQQLAFGEAQKRTNVDSSRAYFESQKLQDSRVEEMAATVNAWQPPTTDHAELKKFMLDQLSLSKSGGYAAKSLASALAKSPQEYFIAALEGARENIEFYTVEQAKEIKRANDRTEWVQQLRNSIKAK